MKVGDIVLVTRTHSQMYQENSYQGLATKGCISMILCKSIMGSIGITFNGENSIEITGRSAWMREKQLKQLKAR